MTEKLKLKIASASCNQTAGDWPRNLANICAAIDKAAEDGADILGLEELTLTGYERGDDFYYSDNAKTRMMLQLVADYAASKAPNMIISIGHPWYFADKTLPDQEERRKNPIFNRINNQFNVQTLLSGGNIVSMSAKRYLFNYERGYEKRHFEEWSDEKADAYENEFGKGRDGTIYIKLPEAKAADGSIIPATVIPFGSPVVAFGDGKRSINLSHIICEEYWVGSRFDASPDNADYAKDNPLARKARKYDITVAMNPNASPPVANKIDKHYELAKLASAHCGVLVHTDGVGSSGSTFAQFGSRLMAQDGKIVSEGQRNSLKDVVYTSQTVEVKPATDKGHKPHAVVSHEFTESHTPALQDGAAKWDKGPRREFEEEMRNEILWLFDYMRKNKIQGITQALSGGKDSAYNAGKVRLMVELAVEELGVEGFIEKMPHLKYKDAVLDAFKAGGKSAAIDKTMEHMLTCVYMGTDSSSDLTLNAARTLVEGGTTKEGEAFKGIGGKFLYRNVQRLVELYAEIYAGVNPSKLADARDGEIRREIADILRLDPKTTPAHEVERRVHAVKTAFEEVTGDVLSIANEKHIVAYENIQARLRQVLIQLFSNVENKLAIANPNLDEGRNSYATFGGDLHGGMISGNAHKGKQREIDHMNLLMEHGLDGIAPMKAFYWSLQPENPSSAELRPLGKDGQIEQKDEDDLERTFDQMDFISDLMLNQRSLAQDERKNNPIEVFEKCRAHKFFEGDSIERLHDRIRISYDRWAFSQFKIHASPIAMTYGRNVDHQSSLRTPNTNAFHRPELAQLAFHCLGLMAERDGTTLEKLTGQSADVLSARALIDDSFAMALTDKMWTPDRGGRLRLSKLDAYIKDNGFDSLVKQGQMSRVFDSASRYRADKKAGKAAASPANDGKPVKKAL